MDRGDPGEEPLDDDLDDEPAPVPGSARDFDYWDVEEALDLDAFDEVEGVERPPVDPEDPVAVDARNRELIAEVFGVDVADERAIGARQARRATTFAGAAARWACPHQHQVDTDPGGWAKDSREWVRHGGDRMTVSGIHEGLFGVCLEAIEGTANALAAQRASRTVRWARTQITNSIRLTRTLPLTWTAWSQGALDARQVGVILYGTKDVRDVALLAQIDLALAGPGETALALTQTLGTGALPPRISEVLAGLDIQVATETSRRKAASRSVKFFPEADGQARMVLEGPAPPSRRYTRRSKPPAWRARAKPGGGTRPGSSRSTRGR